MTKTKASPKNQTDTSPPESTPPKAVQYNKGESPTQAAKSYATLVISPEMASFRVITKRERPDVMESLDLSSLMDVLRQQTKDVHNGDLRLAEAMLMNQATALQSLFVQLAETSMAARLVPQQEMAMRFALKAQSQCRATLETLATIKNPPIVYAKQANIAHGPQQVNNGPKEPDASPRTKKPLNRQNELLVDAKHGSTYLDIGAAPAPTRRYPTVETLEPVHRTPKPRG